MKKILIIGGNSKVGKSFKNKFYNKFNIYSTSRTGKNHNFKLDLLKPCFKTFENFLFDYILICAGISNLKKCEDDNRSYKINVTNTKRTIDYFSNKNSKVFFLSTNIVLSCTYPIQDTNLKPFPLNNYGKHKLEIEEYLKKRNHCIIRLSKIITKNDKFFFKLLNCLNNGLPTKLYTNYKISPISMNYCLKFLLLSFEKNLQGLWHVCSENTLSYYELGIEITRILNKDSKLIIPQKKIKGILPSNPKLNSENNIKQLGFFPQKIKSTLREFLNE